MTVYRVIARRTGEWWALEIPDLPGVFSQAKRLDTADTAAREAIALMLDTHPDSVQVAIEPTLDSKAAKAVEEAETAREVAEEASARAQDAMRVAAGILSETMSQRDAGLVLGVSFQRISQLLKEAKTALKPKSSKASRPDFQERRTRNFAKPPGWREPGRQAKAELPKKKTHLPA